LPSLAFIKRAMGLKLTGWNDDVRNLTFRK
jgi:hypothetical protein